MITTRGLSLALEYRIQVLFHILMQLKRDWKIETWRCIEYRIIDHYKIETLGQLVNFTTELSIIQYVLQYIIQSIVFCVSVLCNQCWT